MIRRRCIRLTVPAELHLVPAARAHARASDLLVADWNLRGAWRREITAAVTPAPIDRTAGAA